MKITFIGGGNMTNALLCGLLRSGVTPDQVSVIEINAEIRARLEQKCGIRCFAAPETEALSCEVLVLAVKPQQMRELCPSIQPFLEQQLVISVAAGLRLADLRRWLNGYPRLMRAMPNTPALISAGITGLYAPIEISEAERLGAERILQTVGATIWIKEEHQMDAVTAISGSGPAYVFLFIEALQKAAEELGFTPTQARQLVLSTVFGATKLATQSDEAAESLRAKVTSKGGTTEVALRTMLENHLPEAIRQGVHAAYQRGNELGELLGKDEFYNNAK